MRTKWALAFVTVTFLSGVTSEHVGAQVTHIKIEALQDPSPIAAQYTQVGGWTVLHSSGSYTCASGTSNKYTISGTPTVTAYDTPSPDYIMFHNATITANHAGVCGRIYFWTKVTAGPTGFVDFDLSTNGSLSRGTGTGVDSWAHFSGWLQHPATTQGEADGTSGTWEHVGSLNGPPTSRSAQDKHVATPSTVSAIPLPNSVDENPDLTGITNPRIMKGEIWFRLAKVGDRLVLNNGSGVKVTTAAGGGGGGDGPRRCDVLDCEWMDSVDTLLDGRVAERLQRLEKHLDLPPLPKPKYDQLEEGKTPKEELEEENIPKEQAK